MKIEKRKILSNTFPNETRIDHQISSYITLFSFFESCTQIHVKVKTFFTFLTIYPISLLYLTNYPSYFPNKKK